MTTLAKWNPWGSLMEELFVAPVAAHGALGRPFAPATDVIETEDAYLFRMDVPDLEEKDLSIEVRDNILYVTGERNQRKEDKRQGYERIERSFGHFTRHLRLPEGVDFEALAASLDKGVLEIRVPKPEEAKPRQVRIPINGNRGDNATIEGSTESTEEIRQVSAETASRN